jgi:hypothetical protein
MFDVLRRALLKFIAQPVRKCNRFGGAPGLSPAEATAAANVGFPPKALFRVGYQASDFDRW